MANRILHAKLYEGFDKEHNSIQVLDVSPKTFKVSVGDTVYLLVENGNTNYGEGDVADVKFQTEHVSPPISAGGPANINQPVFLAEIEKVLGKGLCMYTISITISQDGVTKTWTEDPELEVKQSGGN